jgi:quercetin dioxygenase-like cupin family protein
MVRGSDRSGVDRIVAPPEARDDSSNRPLASGVYPVQLPLPPDEVKGWKSYPIFRGATAGVQDLACHISVLNPRRIPHPPHRHEEEEILLLLAGEVDLVLPDLAAGDAGDRTRLRAGEFVYYPARFTHTLETMSAQPANYLMFKWKGRCQSADMKPAVSFGHFTLLAAAEGHGEMPGYRPHLVLEGQTTWLRKLHCHVSTLAPGAGYEPHVDPYDVAIIALEGELETIGERVKPHGVVFYPSGERHGMRNPGRATAKYVVFEFHGTQSVSDRSVLVLRRWLPTRLASRRYWSKKIGRFLQRPGKTRKQEDAAAQAAGRR